MNKKNVLNWQITLNKIRFTEPLLEDGILGEKTQNAMREFEKMFNEEKCNQESLNRILKEKEDSYLKVPYVSQRDGYEFSFRMCNLACANMILKYNGEDRYSIKDLDVFVDTDTSFKTYAQAHFMFNAIRSGKLEQYSDILRLLLHVKLGKESKFEYIDVKGLENLIQSKIPVILATALPGYKIKDKTKGHYVLLIGKMRDFYIIHDPYGWYKNYSSLNPKTDGEAVMIHKDDLFGDYGCKTAFNELAQTEQNKTRYRAIYVG